MKGRIAVLRVGQLCGDTTQGVWNMNEAWPLMLSSMKVTGSLPDLKDEVLDWLPVDVAAAAVLQAGGLAVSANAATPIWTEQEGIPVYHILNPHHTPQWQDLLRWLRRLHPNFDVLPPKEWVEQLESPKEVVHPAGLLVGLWRAAYCGDDDENAGATTSNEEKDVVEKKDKEGIVFEMEKAEAAVPVMRDVRPVDEELFGKIWRWICGEARVEEDQEVAS